MNPITDRPWLDTELAPNERATKLVEAMTLEEKIEQLHGNMETIDIYALTNSDSKEMTAEEMEQLAAQIRVERHVVANDRLGIPRYRITNGPVGVGMGDGTPSPPATALPMTIGVAASFDPDLAYSYGDLIGSETKTLGQHVLEGPAVCLHRTPIAGRNFEYFSEDPYLSGVMGVQVTRAIQAHNVIAMVKHYAVNDQEYERFRTNVELDEHVLREMYLLPFEMCVKDGEVASVMSAYNRVRGTYATENRYLLDTILRKDWGFEGYVQSDFWSARSCAASLGAGLDHEMPDAKWLNEDNVRAALNDTSLEIETVDRALVRRFTQMFKFGVFETEYAPGEIDAAAHGALSRRMGQEMAVLLKNDAGLLPLSKDVKSVLIVGMDQFVDEACQGGGGSSKVDPLYTVKPLEGMQNILEELGSEARVEKFTVARDHSNLAEAKEKAKEFEVVVIMTGVVATEGADMARPLHPHDQAQMVSQLLGRGEKTVVVLKDSAPMIMPWIDEAETVIEVWNQGAEDGHVVPELLWGVVNPSGKVPTTFARHEKDLMYHGDPVRYPGVDEGEGYPTIRYTEGLNMGYRWFQSQGIKPLFEFGHGLSYTSFDISEVAVSATELAPDVPLTVTARVTNTGDNDGAEVVQVYLGIPVDGQPPKRLVGFQKVFIRSGESRNVVITIDPSATNHPFSVWDQGTGRFEVKPGEYTVHVGTSSENTPDEFKVQIG